MNNYNVDFAKAAGAISTDYKWDSGKPKEAIDHAQKDTKMSLNDVYFGTDCWAQDWDGEKDNGPRTHGEGVNASSMEVGYRGTASGLGVQPLAGTGLSAGLFAPGWAYEHFENNDATLVDRFMWLGENPDKVKALHCNCFEGFEKRHFRDDLKDSAIAKFATQYPAGSESFFHTDYSEAFYSSGGNPYDVHLGRQSVLPLPDQRSAALDVKDATKYASGTMEIQINSGHCTVDVKLNSATDVHDDTQIQGKLMLHQLNVRGDLTPNISITYSKLAASSSLNMWFFATVGDKDEKVVELKAAVDKRDIAVLEVPKTNDRVTGVGILVRGPAKDYAKYVSSGHLPALLNIEELTLRPHGESYPKADIHDAKFVERGSAETQHHRLVWSWSISGDATAPLHLPYSSLTGPFSHFLVSVDGKGLGRAYATEFIIKAEDYDGWQKSRKTSVSVDIDGYGFDGSLIKHSSGTATLT